MRNNGKKSTNGRKRLRHGFFLFLSLATVSCAHQYIRQEPLPKERIDQRQAIVEYAKSLLGTKDLRAVNKNFRNDCTGYLLGVYHTLGYTVKVEPGSGKKSLSELLYLTLKKAGRIYRERIPDIGDAAFFESTLPNTWGHVSHAGLVEQVESDGTVVILHYGSGRVGRIRMNLEHPYQRTDDGGKVINDYVRRDDYGTAKSEFLAGALFTAFGDLPGYCGK